MWNLYAYLCDPPNQSVKRRHVALSKGRPYERSNSVFSKLVQDVVAQFSRQSRLVVDMAFITVTLFGQSYITQLFDLVRRPVTLRAQAIERARKRKVTSLLRA